MDIVRVLAGRRGNPVGMLRDVRARYGTVARIPVGATPYLIISGTEGAKHVLVDNARNYTKGPVYDLLASFLGEGLITAEGEHWKRHRRMVQPALHRDRMPMFVSVMAQEADAAAAVLLDHARRGGTVDVVPLLLDAALRVVARAMLGDAVAGREHEVHQALTHILSTLEHVSVSGARALELLPGGRRLRGLRKLLLALPSARNRRFRASIRQLDDLIYGVIAARRSALGSAAGDDLISQLLHVRDDAGTRLTDGEVRDEVMTMFLAGHETVATGLAWALHLLSRHPEAADAIASEANAALGARRATADDLAALALSGRVFEEAMRLHPPVWRVSRLSLADDRVEGFDIPAGSIAVVATVLIHRDPALWDRPDEFDPSRFEAQASAGRSRLAFMPFGAGQRMCIGASFAMAEAQVMLSTICRAVRLTPVLTSDPPYEPSITLRPRGGVPLTVSARV